MITSQTTSNLETSQLTLVISWDQILVLACYQKLVCKYHTQAAVQEYFAKQPAFCSLFKKITPSQKLSCKFCESFHNSFYTKCFWAFVFELWILVSQISSLTFLVKLTLRTKCSRKLKHIEIHWNIDTNRLTNIGTKTTKHL